jgi:hypothetical protein
MSMLAAPVHARPGPTGEQTVEVIVDRGYRPDFIVARAGVPLRLVFRRRDTDACLDRVVFSSPRIERRLARGATTTIILPGQPSGDVRFTCGMGRYHGQISLRTGVGPTVAEIGQALARQLLPPWRFLHRRNDRTVAEEAVAILRIRFARGELSLEEFQRAQALAGHDDREPGQ